MTTTSLLWDEEKFGDEVDPNVLQAGSLDLTVDWEEHYVDWIGTDQEPGPDGTTEAGVPGVRMVSSASDVTEGEIGLPDPKNPMVAVERGVDDANLAEFMEATAIEAYPDSDGDGSQDDLAGLDACAGDFADLATGLDPAEGDRSANSDTIDAEGNPKPLVSLDDVKPGDFGELTLSLHLCDNPGYVWLTGELYDQADNGQNEPEQTAGDGSEPGELADHIQTLWWYDDGDNVYEPGGEEEAVDLVIVFDQSESMNSGPNSGNNDANPDKLSSAVSGAKSLVDTVGETTNLGLVYFSDDDATQVIQSLGSQRADIERDLDALDGPDTPENPLVDDNQANVESDGSDSPQTDSNGDGKDDDNLIINTDLEDGIRRANEELTGPNARSGARKIMVVLSDGNPWPPGQNVLGAATTAKNDGIEIFSIAYGSDADEALMADIASDPDSTYAFSGGEADVGQIFSEIGQIIGGEKCFLRATLSEALAIMNQNKGVPLDGDRDSVYQEILGLDANGRPIEGEPQQPNDGDDPDREHFVNSTTQAIGMAWWLPRDIPGVNDNLVQSDSVEFGVGFYTEQSRHNDGDSTDVADAEGSELAQGGNE